jgi:simple sugar transport system permease protein
MIASIGSFLTDILSSETMYESIVRFAVVLAFAATGEWVAERAGTLNISVQAMMIAGAFTGGVVFTETDGNHVLGLVAAAAAGAGVAWIHGNLSHRWTIDQFVVGLTLNVLILGLALFLDGEFSPTTKVASGWRIPGLVELPWIGTALFGQPWPMYLIVPVVITAWYLVFHTTWGLEVRAAGENPQAADVSGVHVNRRRRQAVGVAGLFSGLGGGVLVLGQIGIVGFDEGNVGLRGIVAIAAVIFGGWTLRGTIAGCFVFGYFYAFQLALPLLGYQVNAQLMAALPYLVAISATAVFAHRTTQPGALAQPFIRGLT